MPNYRYSLNGPYACLLLSLVVPACSNSNGPGNGGGGGGGNSSLTVSDATPSSGDGGLTNVQVTVDTAAAVVQGPSVRVMVTGAVGGVQHVINLDILKSDQSLPNIEHIWGTDLNNPDGFTLCDAGGLVGSPCPVGQVTADLTAAEVTFSGLDLTAALADGDLSTITGTLAY